jgi:CRP-like cAMP-binding protein
VVKIATFAKPETVSGNLKTTLTIMIDDFFTLLKNIEQEKAEIIISLFKKMSVKKNTILLMEGQICRHNYIVENGLARKYFSYLDKEITTEIYLKGDIAHSFESFTKQTKSDECIVACTELEILCIDFNKYTEAKKSYSWLIELDLMFVEQYAIQLERKLKEQITLNAAERYEKILLNYPKIIQEVPLKIIASYLNVTVERLSRIRAKI